MKSLFIDIANFLQTLSFIDYVLYFAVLVLIILIVSLIYLLRTADIEEELEISNSNDEFDIKDTIEKISQEKPVNIELTQYEQEQEEKAIISYDELVNSIKNNEINYEKSEELDNEVYAKKIDLDNLISEDQKEKVNIKMMNYKHEEAFLKVLKELQELLY